MKTATLFTALLLTSFIGMSQCPTSDIFLSTQSEIDNFASTYPNCSVLNGELNIDGTDSDIVNLDGLSVITDGQQIFIKTTQISDLSGLSNLVTVGQFSLWANGNLQDLTGLSSLQTAGGLEIWINAGIESLAGADNLESLGTLNIFENDNLADISQLSFVENLSSVIIGGNNLSSLTGLENLQSIEEDFILSSEPISNLNELSNLQTIGGSLYMSTNASLNDVSGLSNLTSLFNLHITENSQLSDLSGLENIQSVGGRLRIGDNALINDLSVFSGLTLVNYLDIYDNPNLQTLNGLENLLQIAHRLLIINNQSLTNIDALDNISAAQLDELVLLNNTSLSICNTLLICEVVNDPSILKTIGSNAAGCNSVEEIQESCLLGLDDVDLSTQLDLYPNPVSDVLTISLNGNIQYRNALIYSVLGQQLLETTDHKINLSNLSEGVYLIKIQTDQGAITKKIVKE